MLIDQHMQTADAVYVDFFNRPAATTSALAALALRTGAPVVPVFALPLPGGRFRMVYEHAVEPPPADDPRRDPRVHAALHRRARDVRAPLSRAVAVDAPALARRPGGETVKGMFPAATTDEAPDPSNSLDVSSAPPNWLGDAVMALPAIAALRPHFARRGSPSRPWPRSRRSSTMRRPAAQAAIALEAVQSCRPADGDRPAYRQGAREVALAGGGSSTPRCCLPNSFRAAWTARRRESRAMGLRDGPAGAGC